MHSVTGNDNAPASELSDAPSQQVKPGAALPAILRPCITVVTALRFHGEESVELGNVEHPFYLAARATQNQTTTCLVSLVPDNQQHSETRRIDEFEFRKIYYDRLALPFEQTRRYCLEYCMVDERELTAYRDSRIVIVEFESHVRPLK